MRHILPILAVILLVSSCGTFFSHYGDRRVAAIGRDVLYESEVARLLPEGVSPQDSAVMVRQYADTWALSKLLLLKAEKELSKADADVSGLVEDYRRNLLGFRYEKAYVESKLDTVVSEDEICQYHQEHPANFVFPYSIVKARVVKISTKSPYYEMIRDGFEAEQGAQLTELVKLCKSYAERYADFSGRWVPAATVARELGEETSSFESRIASGSLFEIKSDESMVYLLYIIDRVAPDELSPVEYVSDAIKETIINKRKQALLSEMEQELLSDARNDGKLIIYDYDEQ